MADDSRPSKLTNRDFRKISDLYTKHHEYKKFILMGILFLSMAVGFTINISLLKTICLIIFAICWIVMCIVDYKYSVSIHDSDYFEGKASNVESKYVTVNNKKCIALSKINKNDTCIVVSHGNNYYAVSKSIVKAD